MNLKSQLKSIGGSLFNHFAVALDQVNERVQHHANSQRLRGNQALKPRSQRGNPRQHQRSSRPALEEIDCPQPDQPQEQLLKQLSDLKFALNESAIIALTDAQGRITEVNDRFCAISQYNREELVGQTHHIINSGYHSPAFFQDLWQTISRGQVWKGEIKNRAKDGSEYWVDTVIVPFLNNRGVPFQYMAVRFDITRHKQMEVALRQSQSRLAEAQRIANLGTWEFDLRTQQLSWSEELFRMCGMDPAQAEPTYGQFQQLVHSEDWPTVETAIGQAIAQGLPYEVEYRMIRPDGSICYLFSKGEAILDFQGRPIKLIGTGQDQTTSKLAEMALRDSEQQKQAILSAIPDIMTVLSADGHYLSISYNEFKGDLIPLKDMNPTGKHISEVFPPEITARWTEAIREALRTGKMQTHEQQLRFGDRIQYEEVRIVPYTTDAVLCMVRNISDRKRAEIALQESEAKFRRLAENGPGMIHRYVIHPDGSDQFAYISPQCEAIYELDRETVIQDSSVLWATVHPEDVARFQAEIASSLQNWQNFYSEHRIITAKSRTLKWVQVLSSPERMDNGDIFWEGVVIDVTARRQAEVALQESEIRLRRLTENIPGAVYRYVKHTDGTESFPYISSRILEIYGLEPEAVMQDAGLMWATVHPEDVPKIEAKFEVALHSSDQIFNVEYRIITPLGQLKWAQAISRFDRLENGDVVWDGVIIDISPRKQLEADRQYAETQLAEQNALLARVARGESLADIFNALIHLVEQKIDGALCSFLLLDEENRLRHGAAPSLPQGYVQAVDGVLIGDGIGSCGTAAYRRETVIVTDILSDPLWQNFQAIAIQYGLEACWSTPVFASDGRVLGTFGVYYREVKSPTEYELSTINQIANIAGIAIERDRAETALRQSEAKNRAMLAALPDLLLRVKLDGTCVDYIPPCTTSDAQFVPIQDHLAEVLPPDLLQHQLERMQQALITGELQVWEQQVPKFGKLHDEEIRLVHCEADEFLLVVRDITSRKQAETALRESEIRFRQLSETVKEGFFVAELNPLKYLYVNPAYADLIGVSAEAIYQDPDHWISHVHPDDYDRVKTALEHELQGEIFDTEYRFIQPDGTELWLRSQAFPVFDEAGQVIRVVGIMEDICDRKQTEAALRESEARFRQIAETVQEGFFVGEVMPFQYTYVNPAYEAITGFTASEIYTDSSHWLNHIHPDDRGYILEALQRELQGEIFDQEYRFIRPDGQVCWLRSQGFPLRDETGVITRVVGTQENIDSRKRAELALRKAEERYTLATRAAKVGVWEWNLKTNDFFLDPNIKALLGYTDAEIPNDLEQWTTYIHPDDREAVMAAAQDHLDGKTPEYVFEHRMMHRDGSHIWILVRGQLLQDEQGNPERLVGTDTDITDLKQAELALQRLNEELEQRVQQRTRELFQSERDLRTIFNNVYDAIFIHDLDGTILDVNDRAVEMFGTTRGHLLSCSVADLAPPGHPVEQIPLFFQQAWTEGGAQAQWGGQRLNTGEAFETEVTLRLAQLGTRPVCIACVRDISDRKQAEMALRESEERFRVIFEQAPVGIVRADLEGRLIQMNQEFCTIVGYSETELQGKCFVDITHPDDLEEDLAHVSQLFESSKSSFVIEKRYIKPDGSFVWAILSVSLVRNSAGEPEYFIGIAKDISDRKNAEAALRKSEALLAEAQEVAKLGSWEYNLTTQKTTWTPALFNIFELNPTQPVPTLAEMEPYYHPDDLALLKQLTAYTIATGEPYQLTLRVPRKDGSWRYVESTGRVEYNERGEAIRLYGTAQNITARKRAELALQESEERFRQLAENVDEVFWLTDLQPQMLYISPAFERVWGRSARELFESFENFLDTIHPDDRADSISKMERRFHGDFDVEYRIIRPDGEVRWIRDRAFPIRNDKGEIYRIAGLAEDITERVLTKQALEQSEQRFRNLFEATPNPIQGYDKDRRVIFWNSASEALYGYTQAEALGKRVEELLIPPPMQPVVLPIVDAWIAGKGEPLPNGELELLCKNGTITTVYSSHVMLTNVDGEQEMYCIDVDLSDRKHLEQQLRQMNADLESRVHERTLDLQQAMEAAETANRAKSTFLANMSHELRTPLNAILGFAQLMSRDLTLEPEKRNQLGIINRSGNHLLSLINDILEMSKIEAGRIHFLPHSFDLYALLDTMEEMFGIRAIEKNLQFTIDRAPNLPRYIETDENKLRQILINLIGNAVKFTQIGTVALRVYAEQPLTYPITLHFEVEDTGPGIDPRELDSLFEPFIQSSNRQVTQEGTGLGLPISRQFVHLMGGHLNVKSSLGSGSTFAVTIPVHVAQSEQLTDSSRHRQILSLAPNHPSYRILVVEDNDTNRQLLVQLLQSVGFEVQTALNGREAIALWQSWHPHLIWMDMRMPVMDGYEATRQIRLHESSVLSPASSPQDNEQRTTENSQTPILALTASAFEEDRAKVFGAGCNDFIRKPFQEHELLEKMAEYLAVDYLYVDLNQAYTDTAQTLTPAEAIAALQSLPAALLSELHQATIELNGEYLTCLISQIRLEYPSLASVLTEKLNNFDFEQILNLLQETMPHE